MPAISVLMSVYNGELFLAQAVESILAQDFTDFEFIIINDGSQDSSSDMLHRYAQEDSRICLHEQDNKGLVAALNKGLKLAQAPLIARMDADDIALPDRLGVQKAHMDANLDTGVLGSAVMIIDSQSEAVKPMSYPQGGEMLDHYLKNLGSPLAHPAVMMRREIALQVGGYREAFKHAEDYDLWLRMQKVTNIENLPGILLHYRQHDQKVSVQHSYDQARASLLARYINCRDLNLKALADFDALRASLSHSERNKIDWEVLDVMAGSYLLTPRAINFSDFEQKQPAKIGPESQAVAVRVFCKLSCIAAKNKEYIRSSGYLCKACYSAPAVFLKLAAQQLTKKL